MHDHLYQLELSLLTSEIRKSPKVLNLLLAEEFSEFGSLGKIYNKQTIITTLPLEDVIKGTIKDFNVTELSKEVMLVTYRALRSSIWRNNADRWQMIFHQGTLIRQ